MSKVVRWQGTATAHSSIVHSEQSLGTVRYLRRERFILPSGEVEDIPVVSGNAWRGLVRRECADIWWEAVGKPKLTLAVAHAIWSGGALAKSSGAPLSGSRLMKVREYCPVVGLFGTAGGGRIVEGRVQFGKLIPICQETRHIIPLSYLDNEEKLPSLWDLTQIEYYSKFPSTIAGSDVVELPDESLQKIEVSDEAEDSQDEALMSRFGVESFIAGTRFYTWVNCSWASPAELSLFTDSLNSYTNNGKVGGFLRSGHGLLDFSLNQISGESLENIDTSLWRNSISLNDDFLEVLAWMD